MVLYMLYTCEKQKTLGSIRKNFEKICFVLVVNGKIKTASPANLGGRCSYISHTHYFFQMAFPAD